MEPSAETGEELVTGTSLCMCGQILEVVTVILDGDKIDKRHNTSSSRIQGEGTLWGKLLEQPLDPT
jgi:hypothetical protein